MQLNYCSDVFCDATILTPHATTEYFENLDCEFLILLHFIPKTEKKTVI